MTTDYLSNLLFSSEYKSLFILIGLYFIKRHVQRVKCFIKPFTRLETSSTFPNSHQKNSTENSAFEFQSIERIFRLIECSFRSIELESTSDRTRQKLQDFFFTILIHRAKTSTNRKNLIQNFHLENSEHEFSLYETIFSKFKQYYYNISLYILIHTTIRLVTLLLKELIPHGFIIFQDSDDDDVDDHTPIAMNLLSENLHQEICSC